MSRQNMSFSQLIEYMDKEQTLDSFSHNLYSFKKQDIIKEFEQNSELLTHARGKVYLYHEVIALQKNNLPIEKQLKILRDLAELYTLKRGYEHLVYGKVHNDTDHLHIHLLISANKLNENKRTRLSKKEFSNIQKFVEAYKNKKYENVLELTHNYLQEPTKVKESRKEQEIKHKRKKQTKKEFISENVTASLNSSLSQSAFEKSLENKGLKFYQNGNTIGVTYENKNYRLKTLGLLEEYQKILTKFKQKEKRTEKRNDFKESKKKAKGYTKEL